MEADEVWLAQLASLAPHEVVTAAAPEAVQEACWGGRG